MTAAPSAPAAPPERCPTYDDVFRAAEAYMRECENPVPDYMHRRHLREHLFVTVRKARPDCGGAGQRKEKTE